MSRIQALHRIGAFAEIGAIKIAAFVVGFITSLLSVVITAGMVVGAVVVILDLLFHLLTGRGFIARLVPGWRGVYKTRLVIWYRNLWTFALFGNGEWEPLPQPDTEDRV